MGKTVEITEPSIGRSLSNPDVKRITAYMELAGNEEVFASSSPTPRKQE